MGIRDWQTMVSEARAFDGVAADYDATFTRTRLGRWLRQGVWERAGAVFRPGDHVLELGCGTGEDAVWLAERGVRVTATDVSPRMLELAAAKVAAAGLENQVELALLDLDDLPTWAPGRTFDGALSNFGALNCLPDRRPLAEALARRVRAGGRLVLVVMGPFCPWELAWYLSHGHPRTALRRWRSGVKAGLGDGATVRVWYPSPRRLRTEFAPFFRPVETAGIGALLPPPYLRHLVERWPGFFGRLATWERRWRDRFPWTWLNDHYLMVLEQRSTHDPPVH